MATLQRSYEDVIQLFGKSGRYLTPTMFGSGRLAFDKEPELKNDPRFKLYPQWMQEEVAHQPTGAAPAPGNGKMVMDVMKAGGVIVAGTDTPNAINLHGELMSYVAAGMSTFDAIKAATVNPAKALNVESGTIEPGKLADIIFVEGDPLTDISRLHHVHRVIANGRVYEIGELLKGAAPARTTAAQ
jgi:hypothetical protein